MATDHLNTKLALGAQEVADAIGISRTSVYGLIKSGQLKPIRLAGRTLFAADDVKALLEQHRAS